MKRWKRAGIYILLVLVIIAGFLLPTGMSRIQDAQNDMTQVAVSASRVQLDMGSALTVLQKMRMISESTSSVELEAAQNLSEDQAFDELVSGLEELFSLEDLVFPLTVEGFTEVNHQIILKMSGEDSLIYWEYWLADADGNQISAAVDDDTGLIMSMRYTLNTIPPEERSEEKDPLVPATPLFLNQDFPNDPASIFARNGIFDGLEEMGSSAEEFAAALQEQYCATYLRGRGYRFDWDVDTSEPEGSSYLYSVMMVDNAGGYYVLPLMVTNNEVSIN